MPDHAARHANRLAVHIGVSRLRPVIGRAVIVAAVCLAGCSLAIAQTSPPAASEIERRRHAAELDARFIDLQSARSEPDADRIVTEIWELWLQSGDGEIDTLVGRAVANMRVSNFAGALAILDEVVKRKPDYAEGWNKRATVLYLMDAYDRSLADCVEVLRREPRHFGALAGMGLIAMARDDAKAALAAFKRALAVNPFLKERNGLIPELERRLGVKPL